MWVGSGMYFLLATVAVGRVWCGWLCPQTVFMEMVFRRLEYWIDGSAEQQLRREKAILSGGLHPHYAATTQTIAHAEGMEIVRLPAAAAP